ncbi:MAG: arginine--tRNA ligase, partial [Acholeplasmataceae bacterium]|nr:arginine--tRNA ligase [Acholeplasmataceae bacterium]
MIDQTKYVIKEHLNRIFKDEEMTVEEPKKGHADLAIPLFSLAKNERVSPIVIFERIREVIESIDSVDSVVFQNGFLNIFLERKKNSFEVITSILEQGQSYGDDTVGNSKTVVIDYSSPNIAKSFSVGHLRSTMIGNALKHIYRKLGYTVVGINHLGDWGTQFGKMIVAYHKWGDDQAINANPIATLQALYVRFHEEAEHHPELEDQARHALLKLEQGDSEHLRLWQWFKDESLKEFMSMYDMLGVSFDSYDGESFYNDKMQAVVNSLDDMGLLSIDEGATIVNLGESVPPALIKRSDGGTLYITRDLAALLYRYRTYHFEKILYVVGNEQMLHFKQLKMVSDLMGYDFELDHINFGLVLIDGKKMSTRSGQFKRLEDVIEQAISLAKDAITQKNP